MLRPDLYDTDDAELQTARIRSFAVLYRAVEQGLGSDDPDAVMGTAIATRSAVHGFDALALGGNFPPELTTDADSFARRRSRGVGRPVPDGLDHGADGGGRAGGHDHVPVRPHAPV